MGDTRVLFVLVVQAFQTGATPENIVRMFETLNLADTYAVVSYYLRHQSEVEERQAESDRQAEDARKKIEERQGLQTGLREKLLRRLEEKQTHTSE